LGIFTTLKPECPRKRLDAVYNICKGKTVCEGGDELDADQKKVETEEDDGPKVSIFIYIILYIFFIFPLLDFLFLPYGVLRI